MRWEHRDLAGATAFLAQAIARRRVTPTAVIIEGHQAYWRAVEAAPGAMHTVIGRQRTDGHETAQPVGCPHAPVKERPRPLRGRQAMATG